MMKKGGKYKKVNGTEEENREENSKCASQGFLLLIDLIVNIFLPPSRPVLFHPPPLTVFHFIVFACHGAAVVAALLTAHSPSPSDSVPQPSELHSPCPLPPACAAPFRTCPCPSSSGLPSRVCRNICLCYLWQHCSHCCCSRAGLVVVVVVAAVVPAEALRVFSRAKRLQRTGAVQVCFCHCVFNFDFDTATTAAATTTTSTSVSGR